MLSYAPLSLPLDVERLPPVRWVPGSPKASWREEALCMTLPTRRDPKKPHEATVEDFSVEFDVEAIDRAQRKCLECSARLNCLADALADDQAQGVRGAFRFQVGGLDEESRKLIKRLYHIVARKTPPSGATKAQKSRSASAMRVES